MKTPLTLHVEPDVVRRAQAVAAERGVALSELVVRYLEELGGRHQADAAPAAWQETVGPRVRALLDRPPPQRAVSEEDYLRHLHDKHA